MKYTTVRAELGKRHPDLNNVIVDVLGGYTNGLRDQLITVIKAATRRVLRTCQRISCCMLLEDNKASGGMNYKSIPFIHFM